MRLLSKVCWTIAVKNNACNQEIAYEHLLGFYAVLRDNVSLWMADVRGLLPHADSSGDQAATHGYCGLLLPT